MRLFPGLAPIAIGAALTLGSGCGSSSPETLTCAWLASPDNCWRNTAVMATACLPPDAESGTFSADNSTCTYPSGSVVTFMPPLVLPPPNGTGMEWDVTVTGANGQLCVRYQDNNGGLTLTVGSQTVRESLSGGLGLAISCPDGKGVSTSNAFSLLSCPDGGVNDLPGLAWSGSSTAMSAGILGTGETSVGLFDCRRPDPAP